MNFLMPLSITMSHSILTAYTSCILDHIAERVRFEMQSGARYAHTQMRSKRMVVMVSRLHKPSARPITIDSELVVGASAGA